MILSKIVISTRNPLIFYLFNNLKLLYNTKINVLKRGGAKALGPEIS